MTTGEYIACDRVRYTSDRLDSMSDEAFFDMEYKGDNKEKDFEDYKANLQN